MKGATRVRPRFGPALRQCVRSRRVLYGVIACVMLYWLLPSLTFSSGDCQSIAVPRYEDDPATLEQFWDHKSVVRPTGVSVLWIMRMVASARLCEEGVEAVEQTQLTLAHVQATGFAKSTVLLTEQLAINLGDVVALGESIFAVLYRPYNFNTERKPYRVLRMDLSLEDPRSELKELAVPNAERVLLLALDGDVAMVAAPATCTTHFTLQRIGSGSERIVGYSMPRSARVVDFVRLGGASTTFILRTANCGSGLDDWLMCGLDSGECTVMDLPPGAIVRYYSEANRLVVFTAHFGPVEPGGADKCWTSDPTNVRTPTEAEDPLQQRLCECGAFCAARTRNSVEVHAYVAIPGGGFRYDTATVPVLPPAALGWPGAQFPPVSFASHAVLGLTGEEYVRVWRGQRRVEELVVQALSVETHGVDLLVMQSPLVPFPAPRFERLMPGEWARCPVPRRLTHIESPTLPAVALTFSDAPAPVVKKLLPLLHRLGIRATFFVHGESAMQYPDLVHLMALEGHDIGVEAMHSHNLAELSSGEIEREISNVLGLVHGLTGSRPCLMRPPGAHTSADVESVIEVFGLSSSYPTLTLPTARQYRPAMARAFDMWPGLVFPHRAPCRGACRGAVLELSLRDVADVAGALETLEKGVEDLRAAKQAVFVRVSGEQFPPYADQVPAPEAE